MIDFFAVDRTPWPRRLWDVGTLLALEELWEAGAWAAEKVLSASACDWQRAELRRTVGPDLGLGQRELRQELTRLLSDSLPAPSPARRRFRELIAHARSGYVERWATAVERSTIGGPTPERLSRSIASHLLDSGYSDTYLTAWAGDLGRAGATTIDMVHDAVRLSQASPQLFDVLIAFQSIPESKLAAIQPSWLDNHATIKWLKDNGFDTKDIRPGGGFRYQLAALDAFGAADLARQLVERMLARSSYRRERRDEMKPAPYIWVKGHPAPIPLAKPARGANVLALTHEGHFYRVEGRLSALDDALELAAPVNQGALGPAIAGAWAAVESLLSDPDDPLDEARSGKAVAADRLAAVIACAWPRAELTALSHRHRPPEPDTLTVALAGCRSTIARAQAVADAIKMQNPAPHIGGFRIGRYSDLAAIERMARVLADPRRTLGAAARTFRVALRRLYRARNIVLHGGSTQGVAVAAALRIAAPLIGAGLDRVTHAALTEGADPLRLAARAELALALVDGETGLSVVELLEPLHRPRATALAS